MDIEITLAINTKYIRFSELKIGDVFRVGTQLLMKTNRINIDALSVVQIINTVELNTGRLSYTDDITVVAVTSKLSATDDEDIS